MSASSENSHQPRSSSGSPTVAISQSSTATTSKSRYTRLLNRASPHTSAGPSAGGGGPLGAQARERVARERMRRAVFGPREEPVVVVEVPIERIGGRARVVLHVERDRRRADGRRPSHRCRSTTRALARRASRRATNPRPAYGGASVGMRPDTRSMIQNGFPNQRSSRSNRCTLAIGTSECSPTLCMTANCCSKSGSKNTW